MGKKSRRNRTNKAAPTGGAPVSDPNVVAGSALSRFRGATNFAPPRTDDDEDPQAKADRCRKDFLRFSKEDKWAVERFLAARRYEDALGEITENRDNQTKHWVVSAVDLRVVVEMSESTSEVPNIRSFFYYLRCRICISRMEIEDAGDCLRRAIAICQAAIGTDERRTLDANSRAARSFFVRDTLGETLRLAQDVLQDMRSKVAVIKDEEGTPIKKLPLLGSDYCSTCGTTYQDVGVEEFNCCSRCHLTFYCSRECQKIDWKAGGHKHKCRIEGEFQTGDHAVCIDSTWKIEFGCRVLIVGDVETCKKWYKNQGLKDPDPKNCNRFLVTLASGDGLAVPVCIKKLRRLRPDIWKGKMMPIAEAEALFN